MGEFAVGIEGVVGGALVVDGFTGGLDLHEGALVGTGGCPGAGITVSGYGFLEPGDGKVGEGGFPVLGEFEEGGDTGGLADGAGNGHLGVDEWSDILSSSVIPEEGRDIAAEVLDGSGHGGYGRELIVMLRG